MRFRGQGVAVALCSALLGATLGAVRVMSFDAEHDIETVSSGTIRLVAEALHALIARGAQSVAVCACWSAGNRRLLREMSRAGVALRFLRGSKYTTAAFIGAVLRGHRSHPGHRIAVVVDTSCPAAGRFLRMASRLRLFSTSLAWLILEEGLLRPEGPEHPDTQSDGDLDFSEWSSVPEVRVGARLRQDALEESDNLLLEVAAPRPKDTRGTQDTDDQNSETPSFGGGLPNEVKRSRAHPSRLSPKGVELVNDHLILSDSDVWWLQSGPSRSAHLFVVFRTSPAAKPQAYCLAESSFTHRPTWNWTLSLADEDNIIRKKWDLEGASIRAPIVVNDPAEFTDIEDNGKRRYDVYIKLNFPIVKMIAEKMNFNLLVLNLTDYGYTVDAEGQFPGAMGMLQRHECDMLGTSIQPRYERLPVVDMIAETYAISTGAVYRQASHGHASDMFVKPFEPAVWLAVASLAAGSGGVLLLSTRFWRGRPRPPHQDHGHQGQHRDHLDGVSDCLTCIVGVLCQQGSNYVPHTTSARIALASFLLANVFVYNSFAASILAQSQAPSEPLPSIASLIASSFKVGAEDAPWVHYWFKTEEQQGVRELFAKKIKTHGRPGFLKAAEGIAKVRRGGFAFQIDLNEAWLHVQDTFLQHEKCDLHVMELFPHFATVLVAAKMSPYREAMSRIVRWLRETGHIERTARRWLNPKPTCSSRARGFTPLSLREVGPPLTLCFCGTGVAVVLLCVEIVYHALRPQSKSLC